MILITEDGHENIIKYCNRGIDGRVFADAREMDAVMIARWNEVVGPDDTVYHLGDFALCPDWRKREILHSLNGRKILIVGNHDMWPKSRYRVDRTSEWNVELACEDYLALGFDEVYPEGVIEIAPIAYMRGRTLNNAYIVIDEAQNCTYGQLKMLLTRLGWNSSMVVTGDPAQSDLLPGMSGLSDVVEKLEALENVRAIRFTREDVVRHPLVAEMIDAL